MVKSAQPSDVSHGAYVQPTGIGVYEPMDLVIRDMELDFRSYWEDGASSGVWHG